MITYKYINKSSDIKTNLKAITEFWKDNWLYCNELDNILIFYKKVIKQEETKAKYEEAWTEFTEFIKEYRTINNKWSYDERLVWKYKIVLEKNKHTDIMQNLSDYKKHLEAFNKPPLQVGTYINQKRYLDKFETIKVDFSIRWRIDLLKELKVPEEYISKINARAKIRDDTHWKTKEMTTAVFTDIINSYYKVLK